MKWKIIKISCDTEFEDDCDGSEMFWEGDYDTQVDPDWEVYDLLPSSEIFNMTLVYIPGLTEVVTELESAESKIEGSQNETEELEEGEFEDDSDGDGMAELRYEYSEEQWSPLNSDRKFLLLFQNDITAKCIPTGVPDIPDLILDKVIDSALDTEKNIGDYETLTTDLLEWIEQTIMILNDRQFSNSLSDVQQQLTAFNLYRTLEKPPKFVEKGNLEIMLFTLQSKMRANNQRPYLPVEGKLISDINKAWDKLETAEHDRELALCKELIRKDNVIKLWNYLLELLLARRMRLELSLQQQKIFQEIMYKLDWKKEIKSQLISEDYGKHLMGMGDLLQKQGLLESDIHVLGGCVKTDIHQTNRFVNGDFTEVGGYHPSDPEIVKDRISTLENAYEGLRRLADDCKGCLHKSRKLWQSYWDMANEEGWIGEKEQLMSAPDLGHDLTSVHLLNKQKTMEDEMTARHTHLQCVLQVSSDLISARNFGAEKIQECIHEINKQLECLIDFVSFRTKRLNEAVDLAVDQLQGCVEASVQSILEKYKDVTDELKNFPSVIDALHEQAANLGEQDCESESMQTTLGGINRCYQELLELAKRRKQRLLGALSLYKLFHEADCVKTWIDEKEKLLTTMIITDDIERLAIMKHRFEGFQCEMNANASKIGVVNQLARQLLLLEHLNADEVILRHNDLNTGWNNLCELVEAKRDEIEHNETITWIHEKAKIPESTEHLANDLIGVLTLQHHLSSMEHDRAAIQAKLESLQSEAERLEEEEPDETEAIREQIAEISNVWVNLKDMDHDEKLGETGELQRFLGNLDHFQQWLSRTQTTVASEDAPNGLTVAERLLNQHQQLKDEIDVYVPEYAKMKEFGGRVTEGQIDPQYMFLAQYYYDASEAEFWMSEQELYMMGEVRAKDEIGAQNMMKKHQALENVVEDYANVVRQLGEQSRALINQDHPERCDFPPQYSLVVGKRDVFDPGGHGQGQDHGTSTPTGSGKAPLTKQNSSDTESRDPPWTKKRCVGILLVTIERIILIKYFEWMKLYLMIRTLSIML